MSCSSATEGTSDTQIEVEIWMQPHVYPSMSTSSHAGNSSRWGIRWWLWFLARVEHRLCILTMIRGVSFSWDTGVSMYSAFTIQRTKKMIRPFQRKRRRSIMDVGAYFFYCLSPRYLRQEPRHEVQPRGEQAMPLKPTFRIWNLINREDILNGLAAGWGF